MDYVWCVAVFVDRCAWFGLMCLRVVFALLCVVWVVSSFVLLLFVWLCVVVRFGVVCCVMLSGVFVCGLFVCVLVCAIMSLCVCNREMWYGMSLYVLCCVFVIAVCVRRL